MFGMEKQKKKGAPPFLFDLEVELKDPEKQKEYAKRIEERVGRIKEFLRKGSKKEEYDHLGILLNGYHALAVVLGRASHQASAKK
jgi:P2-related tail formation protein